jgi:uncharacterized protein YggU (UPF0235/DUF167 family)
VTLRVRVQPRSARDGFGGVRDGALVVRVAAPPAEGRANEAVRRVLAAALGVPPSSIQLQRGARGRDKLLHLEGQELNPLRARLERLLRDAGA